MPKFIKGSEDAKEHMAKLRAMRNHNKTKTHDDLIKTNTAEIAVPINLLHIDKKGQPKIINTLTKSGNLTKRDKKPIIKIEPHTDNEIKIINSGTKQMKEQPKLKINMTTMTEKKRNDQIDFIRKSGDYGDIFVNKLKERDDKYIQMIYDGALTGNIETNKEFVRFNKNRFKNYKNKKIS